MIPFRKSMDLGSLFYKRTMCSILCYQNIQSFQVILISSSSNHTGNRFYSKQVKVENPFSFKQSQAYKEKKKESTGHYMLRLTQENCFLSWTRNGMITTVAGVSIFPHSMLASAGFMLMGWSYITIGTIQYIQSNWTFRKQMKLHGSHLSYMAFHALIAWIIWTCSGAYFCYNCFQSSEAREWEKKNVQKVLR